MNAMLHTRRRTPIGKATGTFGGGQEQHRHAKRPRTPDDLATSIVDRRAEHQRAEQRADAMTRRSSVNVRRPVEGALDEQRHHVGS